MKRIDCIPCLALLAILLFPCMEAASQVRDTLYGTWGGWQNGYKYFEANPTDKVLGGYRNGKEHAGFIQFNTSSLAAYKPYNLKLHLKTVEAASPFFGTGIAISSITDGFAPYGDTSQAVIDDIMDGFYDGDGIMGVGMDTFDLSFSNADSVLISQLYSGKYQLGIAHHGPWRRYSSSESFLTLSYDTCIEYSYEIAMPTSCNDSNGTITIHVDSMGTPPYTYFWQRLTGGPLMDTSISNTNFHIISGLSEGDLYKISVADANCNPDSMYIKIPETIELDVKDYKNVSCYGGNDGMIQLDNHGGAAPFSYYWSGNASCTGNSCNSLPAGQDTVIVTDDNGCEGQLRLPINQPPNGDLGLKEILSPASGCGLGMEPVTITVRNNADSDYSSGATAYYSINDAAPDSMALGPISQCNKVDFTFPDSADLSAQGTYHIKAWIALDDTIIDLSNDSITDLVVENDTLITSFPWVENFESEPTLNTTCVGFALQGDCKNAPGADTDWRIYNDDTPTANTGTTGNTNGKYAYVEADCGTGVTGLLRTPCIKFDSLNSLKTDFEYHMFDNGTGQMGDLYIDIFHGGSWSTLDTISGSTTSSNWHLYPSIPLTGYDGVGKLQFRATTGTGIYSDIAIDKINLKKCLDITMVSTNATCYGDSDGSAYVNVISGTQPYTYLWNDSLAQTNDAAVDLPAGWFTVTVTDASGCIATDSIEVVEPDTLQSNLSLDSASCHGFKDGKATASPLGGTPPYSYEWLDSSGNVIGQTNNIAINLNGGATYRVDIIDFLGCEITLLTPPIPQPNPIGLSWNTIDHPSCNGTDGELRLNASGGGDYDFVWSDGYTTTDTSSSTNDTLSAGTYTVTVTKTGKCDTARITLVDSAFTIESLMLTDETCSGLQDGYAGVNSLSGGTPPYSYSWNGGPPTAIPDSSGWGSGNHSIEVSDANNCSDDSTFSILAGNSIVLSPSIGSISCHGDSTTVQANPSGGTTPYAYEWSTTPAQTNDIATGLTAGGYTVTVTDNNNCEADDSLNITQPSAISISITTSPSSTCSPCNGTVTTTVWGGTPLYSYEWNTIPVQTSSNASGLCDGTYTVTVTDGNGCTETSSVTIGFSSSFTLTTSSTPAQCGQNNGTANASPQGGNPPYTYSWSNGATTNTISNLSAGSYDVTVTDDIGCSAWDTVLVNNTNGPGIVFTDSTLVSCNGGNDGSATITPQGGNPPYTYSWSSGATDSIASGLMAGIYFVTVADADTCQAIDSIIIIQPPSIDPIAGSDTTICSNDTVHLSGLIPAACSQQDSTWWETLGDGIFTASHYIPGTSDINNGSVELVFHLSCNGCPSSDTLQVTFHEAPTVYAGPDDSLCNTMVLYNIDSASAGGSAMSWEWSTDGLGIFDSIYSITPKYTISSSDIVFGKVQFVIEAYPDTSSSVCSSVRDSMTLHLPPQPVTTILVDSLPCFGDCTGILSVHTDSTAGNVSYTWKDSSNNTVSNIYEADSLCAGDWYQVQLVNSYCRWFLDTVIPGDTGHSVYFDYPDSSFCKLFPDTMYPLNYEPGGVFNADNGLIIDSATGEIIIHQQDTGTYHIWYSFNGPCQTTQLDTFHLTIRELPPIAFVAQVNNDTMEICENGPDTILNNLVTPPGGIWSGYNVMYDTSSEEYSFLPDSAGKFTLEYEYTDASGCSNRDTLTIVVQESKNPVFYYADTVFCQMDSTILPDSVYTAGGSFFSPWLAVDSVTGAIDLSQTLSITSHDVYHEFEVGGACPTSDTIRISIYPPHPITFTLDTMELCRDTMDTVVLNQYVYQPPGGTWMGDPIDTLLSGETIFLPDTIGLFWFQYTIVDSNLCSNTDSMLAVVKPRPFLHLATDKTICIGDTITGFLNFSGPAQGPFEVIYSINADTFLDTLSSGDSLSFINLPLGVNKIKLISVTSAGDCFGNSDSLTITVVNDPPQPVLSADTTYCKGDSIAPLMAIPDTMGYPDAILAWFEDTMGFSVQDTLATSMEWVPDISLEGVYDYYVIYYDSAVHCFSEPVGVTVTIIEPPDLVASENDTICPGESAQLQATGHTDYTWNPTNDLSSSNIADPVASPEVTTTYFVESVFNERCIVTDSVTIFVDETGCEIKVYNAFSPNMDGKNDLWIIDGISSHPNTITIYNRWEDVVQEFVDYNNTTVVWDGKNKNGEPVPDGTYFYVIEVGSLIQHTLTGWVQITNN